MSDLPQHIHHLEPAHVHLDDNDNDDAEIFPIPQYQGGYILWKDHHNDPPPVTQPPPPPPPSIHPLLATSEDYHRRPTNFGDVLVRDVRYNPLKIDDDPEFKHEQREFAFNPPVTTAVLYCRELPWYVKVENLTGIKVGDVMKRIHDELAEGVTVPEWWLFSSGDRTVASKACREALALGMRTQTEAVRRVDYLGSRHVLHGLRKAASAADQEFIKQRTFNRRRDGEHHYILEFRKGK